MKRALIFQGGWEGHEPVEVSQFYKKILEAAGFQVELHDNMECLSDVKHLRELDLILPMWTMGELDWQHGLNVAEAVNAGVGMVGCHGGMCDAFRNNTVWQFMTGGQWVSHPGGDGVEHEVEIKDSELLEGIQNFKVKSEHYYLHVDPAVKVLASTRFPIVDGPHSPNGPVDMPVTWTKLWGNGRIFYTSLGHHADILEIPEVTEMMKRGILWAAEGKDIAVASGSWETAPTSEELQKYF